MKHTLLFVLYLVAVTCFIVTPAQAHYVYLQPQGSISAITGEAVTVHAYLYAEAEDTIYGWSFIQAFDTAELERISVNLVSTPGTVGTLGSSQYQVAASDFTAFARYDWSFVGLTLEAGESYELFSVTYSFKTGALDGAGDVWLDWTKGSIDVYFWDLDSVPATIDYLPPIVGTGPDYGSNAVPIPGAVWLLGSGLVALVGLKRRTSR